MFCRSGRNLGSGFHHAAKRTGLRPAAPPSCGVATTAGVLAADVCDSFLSAFAIRSLASLAAPPHERGGNSRRRPTCQLVLGGSVWHRRNWTLRSAAAGASGVTHARRRPQKEGERSVPRSPSAGLLRLPGRSRTACWTVLRLLHGTVVPVARACPPSSPASSACRRLTRRRRCRGVPR